MLCSDSMEVIVLLLHSDCNKVGELGYKSRPLEFSVCKYVNSRSICHSALLRL